MKYSPSIYTMAFLLAASAFSQTAPLPAEIRVADETIPAGGTVQLKFSLTEPRPIMTGTKYTNVPSLDALFGVSLYSPAGDVFGVARLRNGEFAVKYISPLLSYGTFVDYPILTVTGHVRNDAYSGAQSSIAVGAGSAYANPFGQIFPYVEPKPGVLTIGGSTMIHNVIPGGGTWPAGTVVKIIGAGFTLDTKIKTKFKAASVRIVSTSEIDVTLQNSTRMDAQPIELTNSAGVKQKYYSYLRGKDVGTSALPLIAAAEPVFPQNGLQRATLSQGGRGFRNDVETALAIQNPNPSPVTIVLTASMRAGQVGQKTIVLAFGEKMTRELGEFFGASLAPGVTVRLSATAPIQMVPFYADTTTESLTPFMALPF